MTTQYNPQTTTGKAITRGAFPKQARSLYTPMDFSIDSTIVASIPASHGVNNVVGLDGAQSVFIDNSLNASTAEILFANNFQIVVPPFAAGIWPVLIDLQGLNFTATSVGGVLMKMWFTNTREQPAIWSTKAIAGTVNVSGSVVTTSPTEGAWIDRSANAAVANTSQVLMPANGNRLGFMIKNPAMAASQNIAAPEPVYINFGVAAAVNGATSFELLPGESLTAQGMGLASTQAINFAAATIGHILIAKEA